ncbi:MAG TPA: hypothetical protein VKW06_14190 [Candidatus Angelobacter sp.]|nr:hypothetical protein [Candidatus Angelobacter sp.]
MPRTIFLWRWLALLLISVPAWPQAPLGELFAADPTAPSAVQTAGTGMVVTAGSQLSAGAAPATLKLYSGGQVRLCPGSKLSVNNDARGLMLGMDTGTIEVDFQVAPNLTAIVFTPDLSIRLAPGAYRFALGVTGQGDTCFKPLPGNASGIVLSELLGSEEYGIVADQTVFVPGGKLNARTALAGACGCPPPPAPLRAEATPAPTPDSAAQKIPAVAAAGPATVAPAPAPSTENPPSRVTVEAPFVFSANAPPAPARVQYSALPNVFLAQEEVDPVVLSGKEAAPVIQPAQPTSSPVPADNTGKKEKKGFLAKLKGFFTGLFHR